MCFVSMVMDHYYDQWQPRVPKPWPVAPFVAQPITQKEVDEFRSLLERAREYDRKNNEPDCELEEKKLKLKTLADELGVKIDFV